MEKESALANLLKSTFSSNEEKQDSIQLPPQVKKIIEEIKQAQEKVDYALQAESFIKLGNYYLGQHEYLYAAAIYNYVLNVYRLKLFKQEQNEKIEQAATKNEAEQKVSKKLISLEEHFIAALRAPLQKLSLDNPYPYLKSNSEHRDCLQKLREDCKQRLADIDNQYPFDIYDEEKAKGQEEKLHRLQLKKAEAIHVLYHEIAERLKDFIRQLIQECIKALGDPPCGYAVIGLGSLSREEATPYSDLEFAILIEEEKEEYKAYFRALTKLLHLKVINLGETILPAMAIPALNNYHTKNAQDNWFYDDITPRGFAFDGAMPQACKTPLGKRDKNEKIIYELIHSPEQMVQFLGKKTDDPAGSYWFDHEPHLSMILLTSSLLSDPKSSEHLVENYRKLMAVALTQPHNKNGKPLHQVWALHLLKGDAFEEDAKGIEKIRGDIQEFRLNPSGEDEEGKPYDIKKEIYRLPDRVLERLAIYYAINKQTAWKRLEALFNNNIGVKHLKVAFSIAIELRLRVYLAQACQNDVMQIGQLVQPRDIAVSQEQHAKFHLSNISQLFRFYYSALPLYGCIADFCEESFHANNQLATGHFFIHYEFFDASFKVRASIYKRLMQYSKSRDDYEKWLKENPNVSIVLSDLGNIYNKEGDFKKAIEYYKRSLKIVEKSDAKKEKIHMNKSVQPKNLNMALLFRNMAISYYRFGKYQEAQDYLEKAVKIIESKWSDKLPTVIADLYHTQGNFFESQQQFELAITYFNKALRIGKELYKEAPNLIISRSLSGLGKVYYVQKNYKEAIKHLEEGLVIEKKLYQNQAHPNIAISLTTLADIYIDWGGYQKAKDYCQQALSMKKVLYQSQAHPSLAFSLNTFGKLYYYLKDYGSSAEYFKLALEMRRKIYKEQPHPETAISLSDLGTAKRFLKKYEEAILNHKEALEMREEVYRDKPHSDIAESYQNLGGVYDDKGDLDTANHYYKKAHAIYEKTLGPSHPNTVKIKRISDFLTSFERKNQGLLEKHQEATAFQPKENKNSSLVERGFFNKRSLTFQQYYCENPIAEQQSLTILNQEILKPMIGNQAFLGYFRQEEKFVLDAVLKVIPKSKELEQIKACLNQFSIPNQEAIYNDVHYLVIPDINGKTAALINAAYEKLQQNRSIAFSNVMQ